MNNISRHEPMTINTIDWSRLENNIKITVFFFHAATLIGKFRGDYIS